jgi:RNA polymerase sigma factor (sigma-70 family)
MYEAQGGTPGATSALAEEAAASPDRKAGTLARARRTVLSDDRLAKQAAAGDIGAFETIFSRYQDDLYRFCVGILREPQDAQDAVQNTMIKAMRALPGERRAMQLKPWLYRIAHNEAVELRRRERQVEELPVTIDDANALTDERAEENGRLRTLLADIADLPERQRASLVLREVNGLGFGEIGDALGTSPGAVRQALYEARRALSEMDNGRGMHCDAATRMVSDTDGSPRDRGVRAHLRDCSPCRRFQAEIRERGRTFAAITPMPALAAAGALKAALGGSGAAAGGSGAAAVAGGAGSGVAGLAGSLGASALLKPAAGLLAVLAIGTAVDHGGIFHSGRHDSRPPDIARATPAPVVRAATGSRGVNRARDGQATARDAAAPIAEAVESASVSRPTHAVAPAPAAEGPVPSTAGPEPRGDAGSRREIELTTTAPSPSVTKSPPLTGTTREEGAAPGSIPSVAGDVPPGQAKKETTSPGQAKKEVAAPAEPTKAGESTTPKTVESEKQVHVAPGQVKKETEQAASPSETSRAAAPPTQPAKVPPGQAKKEAVPPGQAKKQAEPTSEPSESVSGETSTPESAPVEAPGHVPPGQAKKETAESTAALVETTDAAKVPPGQAKKEEAATE